MPGPGVAVAILFGSFGFMPQLTTTTMTATHCKKSFMQLPLLLLFACLLYNSAKYAFVCVVCALHNFLIRLPSRLYLYGHVMKSAVQCCRLTIFNSQFNAQAQSPLCVPHCPFACVFKRVGDSPACVCAYFYALIESNAISFGCSWPRARHESVASHSR